MRMMAVCAALAASGCSLFENGTTSIDAPVVDPDAPTIDAPTVDAPPDGRLPDCCLPLTAAGQVAILETAVMRPGASSEIVAQGLAVDVAFLTSDVAPPSILEEMPGTPLGCKAWSYTPSQAAVAALGLDEGAVAIEVPSGSGTPLVPPCTYQPGLGYQCPHLATESAGGTIEATATAGVARLVDADVVFTAGNSLGRHVHIRGAQPAANNGVFPIVAVESATAITYANPGFVAGDLAPTAVHVNLAGAGPVPVAALAEPGPLADDATVMVRHVVGGGGHVPAFTATTGAASAGDHFTLPDADRDRLNAIPRDGQAFTIRCDAAACGAGSATASLLEIVTSDGPTAGLPATVLPPPVTRSVRVRCAVLGSTSVTVPATFAALLTPASAGATRVRASFQRIGLMGGVPPGVSVFAGHALVGYSP